jgi:O-antigen/teichoic acid export membrane protein
VTGLSLAASIAVAIIGPVAISSVYGIEFLHAGDDLRWLAFLLVPQAIEQPLVAILTSNRRASTMAPYYGAGFILGLAAAAVIIASVPGAVPAGLLIGRFIAVLFPLVKIAISRREQ